ncbi:MAG: helix-turn-helix transcriptional regulator [Clostridia bacterium]|nr:helix-turn-helix transcriptional regulator [Clostridia bacterium]
MLKTPKEVGELIALHRRKKGLTQTELAGMLYVSAQAISKWERGEALPDAERLGDISEALDMKISDFLLLSREEAEEGELPGDEKYRALENKTDLTEVLLLASEMSAGMLKKAYTVLRRVYDIPHLSVLFAYIPTQLMDQLAVEEYRVSGMQFFKYFQPYISSEVSDRYLLAEYTQYGVSAVLPLLVAGKNQKVISFIFRHNTDTRHNWVDFMNHLSVVPQDVLLAQALKITRELSEGLAPWNGWWVRLGSANSVLFLTAWLDEQEDSPAAWAQVAYYYSQMPLDAYARRILDKRVLKVCGEKGFDCIHAMVPYLSPFFFEKLAKAIDPQRDGVTPEDLPKFRDVPSRENEGKFSRLVNFFFKGRDKDGRYHYSNNPQEIYDMGDMGDMGEMDYEDDEDEE